MRLTLTISFCFVFLFSIAQAPSIEWQRSLGGSAFDGNKNGSTGTVSICRTFDGGSIAAGITLSSDGNVKGSGYHGNGDIWIVKQNAKGNISWQKCLGGSNGENPRCIKQTLDSGYIVIGNTTSNDFDVSGNHGATDVWVIKLDTAGNISWQKCLGGSNGDYGINILQTTDSTYIAVSGVESFDGSVNGTFHGYMDYWVTKLNKQGEIIWQKLFGGKGYDLPECIEQTFDGGYIVGGTTNLQDGDISGYLGGGFDGWIVKLDSSGNLEWQKCLGGSGWDEVRKIRQTADSGYIIALLTTSKDVNAAGNHGAADGLVIKLDEDGKVTWSKCFGGSNEEDIQDIQVVNNDYLIAGYSNSVDGDVGGTHGGFDYWVLKTDSVGNIIWEATYGGENEDIPYTIIYTPGVGYLIGGNSKSLSGQVTGNHGDEDLWIVKLKDDNILPVKLVSFSAEKQNSFSILRWQTANEISNSYFDIARSADSKLFFSIGTVKGSNSANTSNYSFTDQAPQNGINYYRLKQVDKDGKYTYSNIISVDFSNIFTAFTLSPNPANDKINIIITPSNTASDIIVYNADGKIVMHEQLAAGIFSEQFDISNLSSGIYTAVLTQNGMRKKIKFLKL